MPPTVAADLKESPLPADVFPMTTRLRGRGATAPGAQAMRYAWSVPVALTLAYGALFFWAATSSPSPRMAVTGLSVVPVAAWSWFRGARAGLMAGLLAVPTHFAVTGLATALTGHTPTVDPAVVAISLALPAIGAAVGWGRRSDDERRAMAGELASHRDDLQSALELAYRRVRLEEALVACSRALLRGQGGDIEASLRGLLQATDCDLLVMARNVEGEPPITAASSDLWVSAVEGDERVTKFRRVDWTMLPQVANRLAEGQVHRFSWLNELPEPDRSTALEAPTRVGSALNLPVMIRGRWTGVVTLGQFEEGRMWRSNEVELLRTIADMVGSSWDRQAALERAHTAIVERDRALRIERALVESSASLLESDSRRPIDDALAAIAQATGVALTFVEENIDVDGEPHRILTHAATREDVGEPVREPMPWSRWPSAYRRLGMGRAYEFSSPLELPDPEQRAYRALPIPAASQLVFPIIVDGTWEGTVGMVDTEHRTWTVTEQRMLQSVARMISAHRARDRVHQALEGLVKSKDRFIASVSHELRTPMSVVMGLSSELNTRWHEFDEREISEFVDLIARQSREVAHIIEDLLVAARANEADLTVHNEVFRLDVQVEDVVRDLPSEYTWRISTKSLEPASVFADPLRVRQIIRNLVVNGHRYGGENMYLGVAINDTDVVFRVADDGPGIPLDKREEIFRPYEIGDRRPRGRTASIGLGLTVSRQLARLMGGDVVYRFDRLSIFELRLPLAVTHQPERMPVPAA